MQKRNEPRQAIRYVSQAEIAVIDGFALMLTDGHTDGHTDRPSCRDARTHLNKGRYRKSVRINTVKSRCRRTRSEESLTNVRVCMG